MGGRGGADEAHGHEAGVLGGRSLGGCEGAHCVFSSLSVVLGVLSGLDVYLHLEQLEALGSLWTLLCAEFSYLTAIAVHEAVTGYLRLSVPGLTCACVFFVN